MEAKQIELIAVSIFTRRDELVQVLTELIFRKSSDSYLLDYNYNVETVLSSDSFMKVNEPLLVLELFLSGEDESIKRVVVELNIDEARAFVSQLKEIEKVRLIANFNFHNHSGPEQFFVFQEFRKSLLTTQYSVGNFDKTS